MTIQGIEAVYLETHNCGNSAKFFQALGFELEFETDHASGQLRNGDGPYSSSPRFQMTRCLTFSSC
jgi:N-acetylglutamate synthase-like GNAT family acetyltransferase